jgi:DNA invertase Pin-like site-specific DNA recombinase
MSAVARLADYRQPDALVLREYLRVSFDSSGRERSQGEQHDDHVAGCSSSRGSFVLSDLPAYRETGSASKFAAKARLDFPRLMDDLAAGSFGADGLLLWTNSRGSRKVSEWIALIELCEEVGTSIVIANQRMRVYDPGDGDDRHTLIAAANDAEHYSAELSKTVRRAMKSNAEAGRAGGGRRAFGYTKVVDGACDEITVEADLIRDAARRVIAGTTSVRALAAEWNAKGVRTSAGNEWHPGPLAAMLRGHRIVGVRTYKGVPVSSGRCLWPAIIDADTHTRLVAALNSRTPVGRRGRTPWLLTGLLYCDRCGAALVSQRDVGGTRRYVCRTGPGYRGCGKLGIKAQDVEDTVIAAVLARLEARRIRAALPTPDDEAERAEVNRIEATRLQHIEMFNAGEETRVDYTKAMADLNRRQEEAERALAAVPRTLGPLDLIAEAGLEGKPWEDHSTEDRRTVIGAWLNRITVRPATTRGSTRFEEARLDPDWRG